MKSRDPALCGGNRARAISHRMQFSCRAKSRQRPYLNLVTIHPSAKRPCLPDKATKHMQIKAIILQPYDPAEAISITVAAGRAGKSDRTIRNWCLDYRIGRRIAGQWAVSAVALDMLLAGDIESLQAYLAGDRTSDRIVSYFRARSIPLPVAVAEIMAPMVSDSSDFAVVETADT